MFQQHCKLANPQNFIRFYLFTWFTFLQCLNWMQISRIFYIYEPGSGQRTQPSSHVKNTSTLRSTTYISKQSSKQLKSMQNFFVYAQAAPSRRNVDKIVLALDLCPMLCWSFTGQIFKSAIKFLNLMRNCLLVFLVADYLNSKKNLCFIFTYQWFN